jgi:hypothetical protein
VLNRLAPRGERRVFSAAVSLRFLVIGALSVGIAAACAPQIGDECSDALDCSVDGTRVCDTTQRGGYCLIPGCRANECPEEAICVQFGELERARTFCMQHCSSAGDCRGAYACRAPEEMGFPSMIVDEDPAGSKFCIEELPSE